MSEPNKVYLGDSVVSSLLVGADLSSCVTWKGQCWANGYGIHRRRYVHRIMAEVWVGSPLPKGSVVHHLCHNRLCINPLHLEIMSQSEHVKRHRLELNSATLRGEEHPNFRKLWGVHMTHRTREQRIDDAKKQWAARRANGNATREKASAIAHKAWITKRAKNPK
jgi:HNH endonuclease